MCGNCTSHKVPLPYNDQQNRVCDTCHKILLQGDSVSTMTPIDVSLVYLAYVYFNTVSIETKKVAVSIYHQRSLFCLMCGAISSTFSWCLFVCMILTG